MEFFATYLSRDLKKIVSWDFLFGKVGQGRNLLSSLTLTCATFDDVISTKGFGKQLKFDSPQDVPLVINPGVIKVAVTILHLSASDLQQTMHQRYGTLPHRLLLGA